MLQEVTTLPNSEATEQAVALNMELQCFCSLQAQNRFSKISFYLFEIRLCPRRQCVLFLALAGAESLNASVVLSFWILTGNNRCFLGMEGIKTGAKELD